MKKGIILLAAIAAIATVGSVIAITQMDTESKTSSGPPKAAIIDMLYHKLPNEDFDLTAKSYLEQAGYEVDLYLTNNSTVNLYRNLPSMNYDYIVFRTHGLAPGTIEPSSSIFTGQVYDTEKFFEEQMTRTIGYGVPYLAEEVEEMGGFAEIRDEWYFTVGSKFVKESMKGQFEGSTIIIAGCDALAGTRLPEAFMEKGASSVIGWDGLVGSRDNDKGVLKVLEEILINGNNPENATEIAMSVLGYRGEYNATLTTFSKI